MIVNDDIDLNTLERLEVGSECFAEVITVSISSNPSPSRNDE